MLCFVPLLRGCVVWLQLCKEEGSFPVVIILLLNVMEVSSVGGGALLDMPCMVFQRMCVFCM